MRLFAVSSFAGIPLFQREHELRLQVFHSRQFQERV